MSLIITSLTTIALLFLLLGCDNVSDVKWVKTIPGYYVGATNGIKEVISLNTNGMFHHEFYFLQQKMVDETGKWKFDVTAGVVQVSPFTSFYNPDLARITTNGVATVSCEIGVLRYGRSAQKISQGLNFEFSLHKNLAL
jgi:hypothetical protein